ncbi:MAG: hypothetical protein METHAR1v1_580008 [Methanothrix sp.]|nr:MAG: hypothetical protein METHAR1v1_580008 [Methanothrix sp.]
MYDLSFVSLSSNGGKASSEDEIADYLEETGRRPEEIPSLRFLRSGEGRGQRSMNSSGMGRSSTYIDITF